jgi:hypothetical protein
MGFMPGIIRPAYDDCNRNATFTACNPFTSRLRLRDVLTRARDQSNSEDYPMDKKPQALNPAAINDAAVHSMYAQNVPGMTDAKLIIDLGALIQHGGKNQLIAAAQVVKELHRRHV